MKATMAMALFGAVLISGPVLAQTARPADQTPAATQQTTQAKGSPLYEMKAGQWRATKLDGLDVYNPNNEKIGDISELIVGRSGKVEAVVIGVGGFLGMGEHQVAVPFDQVQWIDQPREQTVSTRTSPPAVGSGTSAPATNVDRTGQPAATTAPAGNGTGTDRAADTTTRVDPKSGAAVTTTERTTTTDRPATTMADRPAAGAAGSKSAAAYRGYPDHAVVAMTKEQVKALPEVRYSR